VQGTARASPPAAKRYVSHQMEKKLFSSSAFESLTDVDRRSRLDEMEQELKALIGQCSSPQQFMHRTKQSVEILRSMGHDLWNIDSDRKTFEIWESEYIRPKLMGRLVVTFKYPNQVHVEWSSTL
jgi:hypothetical protein